MSKRPDLIQFGSLRAEHFRAHPAWASCHSFDYEEEWFDETDEETFRPWTGPLPVNPSDGMFLVRATVTLRDGSGLSGFVTPQVENETLHLGIIQPQAILPDGTKFGFWFGMVGCDPKHRAGFYRALGKSPGNVVGQLQRQHSFKTTEPRWGASGGSPMSTERQNSAAALIVDVLDHITAAWRGGRPEDMADFLDEQVGMAFPGFTGHLVGRQALIDSFAAFSREARVHDYRQGQVRVDGSGGVAVAQYPFEMVYERDGDQWRSKGWDIWVFEHRGDKWIAVWRTMQALTEERAVP